MEYKIKNLKPNKGFTLVETMIAISILILAILGPLTIASNALHSAYYASDQVTAFYLAQEGIEYMRSLRDNNLIAQESNPNSVSWDQGLTYCDPTDPAGGHLCGLDSAQVFSGTPLSICTTIANCPVLQDASGAFHQGTLQPGWTPTNFYRTILVKKAPFSSNPYQDGKEDQVTVQVTWTTGNLSSPNNFQITENLYNWLGADSPLNQ